MKKIKSIYSCIVLLGAFSMTSCSNDEGIDNSNQGILSVEVGILQESRAPFMSNVFPDNTDYGIICINDNNSNDVQLRKVVYANNTSTIDGDPIILKDDTYTVGAYYPYVSAFTEGWETGIMLNMSQQTDYLFGKVTGLTYNRSNAYITLQHAMALVTFNIRKDYFITQDYELKSVSLEGLNTKGFFNPQKLDYEDTESGYYVQKVYESLNIGDEYVTVDLLVIPTKATNILLGLLINDKPEMQKTFNNNGWEMGYHYTYTVTVTSESVNISEATIDQWTTTTPVEVNNPVAAPGNAVDLGVSKLWADRNLGAFSSSEYGKYFAYNDIASALKAQWGAEWSIPTEEDFEELMSKCDYTWTTINGINGLNFTGNGKTIFFPAGGWINNSSLHNINWGGSYPTASALIWDFSNQKAPQFIYSFEEAQYCIRPVKNK